MQTIVVTIPGTGALDRIKGGEVSSAPAFLILCFLTVDAVEPPPLTPTAISLPQWTVPSNSAPILTLPLFAFIKNTYGCFAYIYVCVSKACLMPTEARRGWWITMGTGN